MPPTRVPFNVYGTRVSSAGGGKVTGGISRNGSVAVRITGRRLMGERPRPARRQFGRRPLERADYRRPLQRRLAGHAERLSVSAK